MDRRVLLASAVPAALTTAALNSGTPATAAPRRPRADDVLQVRDIGSFHVGGRAVTLTGAPLRDAFAGPDQPPAVIDPNGDFEVGQVYVQYCALARPVSPHPLVMWHGGGLTGVCFETTPDGRPGWQRDFLGHGHDVYLTDALAGGRAPFARYPELSGAEPRFRTKRELWELFRFGPAGSYTTEPGHRAPHPDTLFPTASFDTFVKQVVPRFTTYTEATQSAYGALLDRLGTSVVLTHSAAGPLGFAATLAAPHRVAAHVAVEPSGAPDPDTVDLASIRHVPHLIVWGDHLGLDDDPGGSWANLYSSTRRFHDALLAAGGQSTWIDLPDHGVTGNSHMIMMDRNSRDVADLIASWLRRHGLG